jgi:hypothetical protein
MEIFLIIVGILVVLAVYAFIIRPFLVHYYSQIQASAWMDVLKKNNKKTSETKIN